MFSHKLSIEGINVLVLCSGGMDSTACLSYYLVKGYFPMALWVDYGQEAREPELKAVAAVTERLGVPLRTVTIDKINWRHAQTSDELIGRNALLASVGLCSFPGTQGLVAMGIHTGSDYLDCSLEFQHKVDGIARIISAGRLAMDFPFGKLTKLEIGAFCQEYNVPVDLTYSCLRGYVPACQNCSACQDRIRIREIFGI